MQVRGSYIGSGWYETTHVPVLKLFFFSEITVSSYLFTQNNIPVKKESVKTEYSLLSLKLPVFGTSLYVCRMDEIFSSKKARE